MIFDLEVTFTGLCLFTFEGESSCNPDKCKVLLVNADRDYPLCGDLPPGVGPHRHEPRLVVSARHLRILGSENPVPHGVIPGPDGEDHLLFKLSATTVKLEPEEKDKVAPLIVSRNRKKGTYTYPPSEPCSDAAWFDWVARLAEIDKERLGELKAGLAPDVNGDVIATIEFSHGCLETLELAKRMGHETMFHFRKLAKPDSGPVKRCLADRTVLRLKGLRHPLVVHVQPNVGPPQKFGVGPDLLHPTRRPTVRLSITNLEKSYHAFGAPVVDFLWYYELFKWKVNPPPGVKDRFVPWVMGYPSSGLTPSTGTCPPGEP